MTSLLAVYAAHSEHSKGRVHQEGAPPYRNEYQRDRDRIVHCSAFRRLEYKTQVFVNHEGDMFRTRLTHSIEVAQIGRTIARSLQLNEDLTEAICLAHDLGHTPFGHAGQDALNACMKEFGGFEHNLQSLRIVDILERRYAMFPGLNLTFETREGILKHCSKTNALTLGAIGERFINRQKPGLEAQIANIADEIAYNNHDIDDGLRAGLLDIEHLRESELVNKQYEKVKKQWHDIDSNLLRHEIVRRMINTVVSDLIQTSSEQIKKLNPKSIDDIRTHADTLIKMSDHTKVNHKKLKKYLLDNLYRHEKVNCMAENAKETIDFLFNAYLSDNQLLTPVLRNRIAEYDQTATARCIADYIAGMTDRFALLEFKKIHQLDAQKD